MYGSGQESANSNPRTMYFIYSVTGNIFFRNCMYSFSCSNIVGFSFSFIRLLTS